jgi:hypothetical protein
MSDHIDQAELFARAKVGQRTALLAWLKENQIRFRFTRGGKDKGDVWTTQSQIEASFLRQKTENPEGNFGT